MSDTLLLLTPRVLARIDLTGGRRPRIRRSWLRERFETESLATLIDATFRLGPRRAGKVWVVSSDFWLGVVPLSLEITRLVSGDELQQSIASEAETYSGISAFDSRISTKAIPQTSAGGDAHWLCVQIPLADLSEIDSTVRALGATWGGATHPALLMPPQLNGTSTSADKPAWWMIQGWGEAIVASRGSDKLVSDVNVFTGSLESSRLRSELEDWLGESPTLPATTTGYWLTDTATMPSPVDQGLTEQASGAWSDATCIRVDHEPGLLQWATTFAANLHVPDALPVIRAEKRPMSNERATAISVALGLLALLGCVGHHLITKQQITDATTRIEKLEGQAKLLKTSEQALTALEKENIEISKAITSTTTTATKLQREMQLAERKQYFVQHRWLDLVDALVKPQGGKLWLREIRGDDQQAELIGVAISTAIANRFSRSLEESATGNGWLVHPAETKSLDNGLCEFKILLDASDQRPANTPPAGTLAEEVAQSDRRRP